MYGYFNIDSVNNETNSILVVVFREKDSEPELWAVLADDPDDLTALTDLYQIIYGKPPVSVQVYSRIDYTVDGRRKFLKVTF